MAEVWKARDERLGRPVAIKFLSKQFTGSPEFLVRFFSEAQSVAKISHPNVVEVLDFGEHDERPLLVMEYVAGGSLADLEGERLTQQRSFEIIEQVAAGVGAAHRVGLIHRDIKPGNILLDEHGVAKIADFGISSSGVGERMTATGAAIGSPHFISPEQVSGKQASPASDVYSIGIVLYELLTGRRPFEGDNITAVAIAHVDKAPLAPSTHNPDIPPWLDSFVLRCLDKDPKVRFRDGDELAAALAASEPGEYTASAVVAPSVAEEELGEWDEDDQPPARRTLVGTGLVVLLLALASAGVVAASRKNSESGPKLPANVTSEDNGSVGRKPKKKSAPSPSSSATQTSTSEAAEASSDTPSPEPKKKPGGKDRPGGGDTQSGNVDPDPEPVDEEPEPEPSPSPTAEPSPTSEGRVEVGAKGPGLRYAPSKGISKIVSG
jgi:serine/threonine-protein kinase